jgi:hypothetical protein
MADILAGRVEWPQRMSIDDEDACPICGYDDVDLCEICWACTVCCRCDLDQAMDDLATLIEEMTV